MAVPFKVSLCLVLKEKTRVEKLFGEVTPTQLLFITAIHSFIRSFIHLYHHHSSTMSEKKAIFNFSLSLSPSHSTAEQAVRNKKIRTMLETNKRISDHDSVYHQFVTTSIKRLENHHLEVPASFLNFTPPEDTSQSHPNGTYWNSSAI